MVSGVVTHGRMELPWMTVSSMRWADGSWNLDDRGLNAQNVMVLAYEWQPVALFATLQLSEIAEGCWKHGGQN
jgi:hypothetical protein